MFEACRELSQELFQVETDSQRGFTVCSGTQSKSLSTELGSDARGRGLRSLMAQNTWDHMAGVTG